MNQLFKTTLLFSLLVFGFGSLVFAQHPIGYASLKGVSQTGNIEFQALDREILKEKPASFFIEAPYTMKFDVLVTAEGNVKYVRSPRCGAAQNQMRLACTSALYGYQFSAISEDQGEKWLKAEVSIAED